MIQILHFYAEWCGPCKMLDPILKELIDENEDLDIVDINIDENEDEASKFGVMSIPTLIFIKDNEEVDRTIGFVDKKTIFEKLAKL